MLRQFGCSAGLLLTIQRADLWLWDHSGKYYTMVLSSCCHVFLIICVFLCWAKQAPFHYATDLKSEENLTVFSVLQLFLAKPVVFHLLSLSNGGCKGNFRRVCKRIYFPRDLHKLLASTISQKILKPILKVSRSRALLVFITTICLRLAFHLNLSLSRPLDFILALSVLQQSALLRAALVRWFAAYSTGMPGGTVIITEVFTISSLYVPLSRGKLKEIPWWSWGGLHEGGLKDHQSLSVWFPFLFPQLMFYFFKSWNSLGWDGLLWLSFPSFPLWWRGTSQLDQVAQSPVQTDLECFQGWGIYHLSGASVYHHNCKKLLLCL